MSSKSPAKAAAGGYKGFQDSGRAVSGVFQPLATRTTGWRGRGFGLVGLIGFRV